jgi:phosphoribosylanthranilate isomerase
MWIKICANTNLEDARLAAELGVDALGFVFAASPRQVDSAHVASITPYLPQQVERIGVFDSVSFVEVELAVKEAGLTGVQLHGGYSPDLVATLREEFGDALRIIQTAHVKTGRADGNHSLAMQLTRLKDELEVDAVLVDSCTAAANGGTGVAFDWQAARAELGNLGTKPFIVAGGLNPANVAEAVRVLQPFGVDVASGVELDGDKRRKDPEKLRAFLENARSAPKQMR